MSQNLSKYFRIC